MMNPLVLVADGDSKNLQILKENLEASGFSVVAVASGNKAWEEIQQTPPNLVLTEINLPGLNGYQLLERLQADPNTKNIPLMFLTNQREIQQRVRGFELGAKDYLVKPLHVKEVIAHIRMVLHRLERRKTEQLETYMKFSGRLDQLNLADLIESFGVERKTGVLTLSNGRRTGQVYFRDGSVVNAKLGNITQEPAIYQMLPWNQGYFNMVFKAVDVPDEISISNLGLLLHGIKRLEIREKLMGQLSSPRTSFTITPTFKLLITKKQVDGEVARFVKLFDGKRDVEQIIDESGMDDLIALKRIVRLYQQGFIKPTIPPEKKPLLREKAEHEEEDEEIDLVTRTRPTPLKQKPLEKQPVEQQFDEDTEFDIQPVEKRRDLEQEIKPIFERIEEEKKKVVIPDKEKISEIIPQVADQEQQEVAEKVEDEELALNYGIEFEDEEIIQPAEKTFVDEELIRKPAQIEDREKLEFKTVKEKAPEPINLEDELDRLIEFETFEAKVQAEEKQKEKPIFEKKSKPIEPPKPEKIEPQITEPPPARDSLLVISVDDDCKDEIMDILTNDTFTFRNIKELNDLRLDTGKIAIEGFTQYKIFAVSVDKPFNVILESLRQKMCGIIFAVDCSRPETWEYTAYLIQSITNKFHLPYVVAVMNFHDQTLVTMDVIRYHLQLEENVTLIAWDAVDRAAIRKLMNTATNFNLTEKTRTISKVVDMHVERVLI